MIYFHPGGYVVEDPSPPYGITDIFNANGFVVIHANYRLLKYRYYFNSSSGPQLEEFVRVHANGSLELVATRDYNFARKITTYEDEPKVFYDATQVVSYVVTHAEELGVDPHRMICHATSTGTSICNHLAFSYQPLYPELFSIRALLYYASQLNHPVCPGLDGVFIQLV